MLGGHTLIFGFPFPLHKIRSLSYTLLQCQKLKYQREILQHLERLGYLLKVCVQPPHNVHVFGIYTPL
jgi:hypothetical protein